MKRNLVQCLTTPLKIVQMLDWHRQSASILAIDVGRGCMGLAVASHPSFGDSARKLDPMPLKLAKLNGNQRVLTKACVDELREIVHSYNVCGFVVSWPVQKEGRLGAPCGRTLHTLDSLISEQFQVVTPSRPVCLWDEHHYAPDEDVFGRAAQYSQTSDKTLYKASEEQYVHICNSQVAVDVWNDFVAKQWPNHIDQEHATGSDGEGHLGLHREEGDSLEGYRLASW